MTTRTVDNSGDGSPSQRQLASLIDVMEQILLSNIDSLSSSQYGAAKSFLVSLDYEGLQPLIISEPNINS